MSIIHDNRAQSKKTKCFNSNKLKHFVQLQKKYAEVGEFGKMKTSENEVDFKLPSTGIVVLRLFDDEVLVRNTIGARSCPRKAWLDHPETGFIATGTLSGVSVAIHNLALLAVHEL